jgi:hypothetical protein
MQAVERESWVSLQESLAEPQQLPAAANQTQVAWALFQAELEHLLIQLVIVRNDEHPIAFA